MRRRVVRHSLCSSHLDRPPACLYPRHDRWHSFKERNLIMGVWFSQILTRRSLIVRRLEEFLECLVTRAVTRMSSNLPDGTGFPSAVSTASDVVRDAVSRTESRTARVKTVGSVHSIQFNALVFEVLDKFWMKHELWVLQRDDLTTAARRGATNTHLSWKLGKVR